MAKGKTQMSFVFLIPYGYFLYVYIIFSQGFVHILCNHFFKWGGGIQIIKLTNEGNEDQSKAYNIHEIYSVSVN